MVSSPCKTSWNVFPCYLFSKRVCVREVWGNLQAVLLGTRLLFAEMFLIMDSVTFTDLEALFYFLMTMFKFYPLSKL